jgi:hypothetical protein
MQQLIWLLEQYIDRLDRCHDANFVDGLGAQLVDDRRLDGNARYGRCFDDSTDRCATNGAGRRGRSERCRGGRAR